MPITEPIDEDELEADLAALEQANLDEQMLKTGTVPVAASLNNRLPTGPNGEREFPPLLLDFTSFSLCANFSFRSLVFCISSFSPNLPPSNRKNSPLQS